MANPHGIRAGAAYVELFLDDSKLSRGLKRAQKKLKAFGTSIQDMGRKMALAGAALSTGLGIGVGAFASFEEAMARVSTILDDADQHYLPGFAKGIRALSVEFGKSTTDIAAGLYDLIGSGIKAADAMSVLRVALKAAVAGNADTATATRVLTAALNAYNLPASKAAAVSDVLFQTVNRGVISFEELSNSAGNVLSIANTAGLRFNALAAAIATMTRAGITGDTAITNLRNILKQFISASPAAQAMAQKYGFSLDAATLQGEGLLGVLQKLKGAPNADLAAIFPDVRGLSGFTALLNHIGGFKDDLNAMAGSAGRTDKAFARMAATFMHGYRQIKQAAINVGVAVGEALAMPLKQYAKAAVGVIQVLGAFIQQHQTMVRWIAIGAVGLTAGGAALVSLGIAAKLAAVAVGGVVSAMSLAGTAISVAAAALTAILAPTGAVIAAFAALAGYLVYASGASGKAIQWLGDRFGDLADFAKQSFGAIAEALAAGDISLAAKVLWTSLKVTFERGVVSIEQVLLGFRNWVLKLFNDIQFGIQSAMEMARNGVTTAVMKVQDLIRDGKQAVQFWSRYRQLSNERDRQVGQADQMLASGQFTQAQHDAQVQIINQRFQTALQALKNHNAAQLAANDKFHDQQLKMWQTQHRRNMSDISDAGKTADAKLDAESKQRIAESEKQLAQAQADWQDAINQARKLPPMKTAAAPGGLNAPPSIKDLLQSVGQQIASQKISVTGTFSGRMLGYLGGNSDTRRLVDASEKTAKNTGRLVQMSFGGSRFA